jgi:hypothetical protein
VNVIRIGGFGKKTPFRAGEQAERSQKGTLKMKRLRITSQQNHFCGFIARHLMTTKVLERLVMDADESEEEDEEEDVEEVEKAPKPKNTVSIEIGQDAYTTPIVYRSDNNKDQTLLRVPMSATEPLFERNMRRINLKITLRRATRKGRNMTRQLPAYGQQRRALQASLVARRQQMIQRSLPVRKNQLKVIRASVNPPFLVWQQEIKLRRSSP